MSLRESKDVKYLLQMNGRQIVLPSKSRSDILELAQSLPFGGSLGVNKTKEIILQHFYWLHSEGMWWRNGVEIPIAVVLCI